MQLEGWRESSSNRQTPQKRNHIVRASRRRFLRTAGAGSLTAGFAGCLDLTGSSRGREGDDSITLGVLAPDYRRDPLGFSIVHGAQLAVDYLNEQRDGILGREVTLAVEDTNASPLQGRRRYQKLIRDDDVDMTLGVVESTTINTIIEEIATHETVHITTGATSGTIDDLLTNDYDRYKYHFRTMLNDMQLLRLQMAFIEEFFVGTLGWERIAVLAEGYRWTDGAVQPYQIALGQVVGHQNVVLADRYPAEIDAEGFGEMYDEIAEKDADVLWALMAHTGDEAIVHWRQWLDQQEGSFGFGGLHVPMQWPGYWDLPGIGDVIEGGITLVSGTPEALVNDTSEAFYEAWAQRFDAQPIYTGNTTYDAVLLYANAVETAGTIDEQEVVPALRNAEVTGVNGEVGFYDEDDEFPNGISWGEGPRLPGAMFVQWQRDDDGGGSQEVVWPEQHVTTDEVILPTGTTRSL